MQMGGNNGLIASCTNEFEYHVTMPLMMSSILVSLRWLVGPIVVGLGKDRLTVKMQGYVKKKML